MKAFKKVSKKLHKNCKNSLHRFTYLIESYRTYVAGDNYTNKERYNPMRKHNRKGKRLFLPMLLLCAAVLFNCLPGADADGNEPLKVGDFFDPEDLRQTADLSNAVKVTVADGQDVTIAEAGVWWLSGTASQATVTVDAGEDDIVQLVLDGLNIENSPDASCIFVKNAKKAILTLVSDNVLSQRAVNGEDSGGKKRDLISCRTDLTMNGNGSLSIQALKSGIACKRNLYITGGTYDILASAHALESECSILIADGILNLKAGKDGFHVETEDDIGGGSVYIGNGSISVRAESDGVQCQTVLQIDGGDLSVEAEEGMEATWIIINGGTARVCAWGDGINAGNKSARYFPTIELNGGKLSVLMEQGRKMDGVDSNGDLIIRGGILELTGSGIDYDADLIFTGGTVFIDGEQVTEIKNQSHHSIQH